MNFAISPENQRYIESLVSDGLYPSSEAAIDAAIAALRLRSNMSEEVPDSHRADVEQAIASSREGMSRPMTPDDWTQLRQSARDAHANR